MRSSDPAAIAAARDPFDFHDFPPFYSGSFTPGDSDHAADPRQ